MNTLFAGMDHVGIAVRNLDEAIKTYCDSLGFKFEGKHVLKERKVKVAFVSMGSEARVELLEPLISDSPIAGFLEKRGEGIHHVAVKVNNIETILNEMKRKGVQLIDEKPQAGAEGAKIAFVSPKSTRGVLRELVERSEKE